MKAHIITIGDEILIGQIVDTNSAFIAQVLNKAGFEIHQISSIQDDKQQILDTFEFAKEHANLVIITGGLGPTKDDVTKHTLCSFFDDTLIEDKAVLEHIRFLFKEYIKKPMLAANETQALVPSTATVLTNRFGTAPGLWMEQNNTVFISLPGVPFEMKHLMEEEVLPAVLKKFHLPYNLHKTLLTYGMGESAIAERIANFENELPPTIKLAYLPSLGRVRLRLSTRGPDKAHIEKAIQRQLNKLLPLIEDIFTGFEEDGGLEVQVAQLLTAKKVTLSLAESCTGGKLAETFTMHPGASSFFKGSTVTYATQSKIDFLGVDKDLIDQFSVVSAEVAAAMARQAQSKFQSDYAVATTGNAGPTKGDADAPVGTVYIAIATPQNVEVSKYMMGNNRERVIGKTVNKALELLKTEILKN